LCLPSGRSVLNVTLAKLQASIELMCAETGVQLLDFRPPGKRDPGEFDR
jgi:hypothetical protein